jgi:hypothetical protein
MFKRLTLVPVIGLLLAVLIAPAAAAATVSSAPRDTKAVPGNARYVVSWQAPSSNGGAAIKYYEIADRTYSTSKKAWGSWRIITSGASTRSKTVFGTNGTLRQTKVRAVNAKGRSAFGATVQVRIGAPTAPSGAKAVAGDASATITWKAANGNGSALTSNRVYQRSYSSGKWSAWTYTSVSGAAASKNVTGLVNARAYEFYVVAINKYGGGPRSAVVKAVPEGAPNPQIVVTPVDAAKPAPFGGGEEIKVSFSGFPFAADAVGIDIAICPADPMLLTGPEACGTFGVSQKIVSSRYGKGSGTLTVPVNGALGNTTGAPLDCRVAGSCAVLATMISSPFLFSNMVPLVYFNPELTVVDTEYAAGDTVTVSFTGFPGASNPINVGVCRGDIPVEQQVGPSDCADFGPSNTLPASVGGSGSVSLLLPATIDVRADTTDPAAAPDGTVLDCSVAGNCIVIGATFNGPFTLATAPLTYTAP